MNINVMFFYFQELKGKSDLWQMSTVSLSTGAPAIATHCVHCKSLDKTWYFSFDMQDSKNKTQNQTLDYL